jgi:hypothetical protein
MSLEDKSFRDRVLERIFTNNPQGAPRVLAHNSPRRSPLLSETLDRIHHQLDKLALRGQNGEKPELVTYYFDEEIGQAVCCTYSAEEIEAWSRALPYFRHTLASVPGADVVTLSQDEEGEFQSRWFPPGLLPGDRSESARNAMLRGLCLTRDCARFNETNAIRCHFEASRDLAREMAERARTEIRPVRIPAPPTDGQVLRRADGAVSFGHVDLADGPEMTYATYARVAGDAHARLAGMIADSVPALAGEAYKRGVEAHHAHLAEQAHASVLGFSSRPQEPTGMPLNCRCVVVPLEDPELLEQRAFFAPREPLPARGVTCCPTNLAGYRCGCPEPSRLDNLKPDPYLGFDVTRDAQLRRATDDYPQNQTVRAEHAANLAAEQAPPAPRKRDPKHDPRPGIDDVGGFSGASWEE